MLEIAIVSDIVCPWCYIGLRRLETALREVRLHHPDVAVRPHWLPFFLNPDTPPEGEPYLPFLEQKFGGRPAVDSLFARVREAGAAYGLRYEFERIPVRANTLQAHRLIHWQQQRGNAATLVEHLFQAQFQEGRHIGDTAVLTEIASSCGLPATEVAAYLASDIDTDHIRRLEKEIRASGIRMVPTFIVGGRRVVIGAEDPSILARAVLDTLAEASAAPA